MVRGPCPVCHPYWVVSLVLQNLLGALWPLRTYELRYPVSGCALHPSLCLGWAPWVIPCYVFSWSEGVVSFAFVTGFVAKTQAPPLPLGLRASLYRPNQRKTIAMGDSYILCGRSGVIWSASAAHRPRCECSLLPQGVTVRSYRRPLSPSSSGCRCHGGAVSRPRNGLFRVL